MLTHWWGLPQLALDALLLLGYLLAPLFRDTGDDQGDGRALVLLPRPHVVRARRTVAFLGVFVVLDLLHEGLRLEGTVDDVYARLVVRIAGTVVVAPSALSDQAAHFPVGVRFLVVATVLSLAATSVGSLPARLRLAYQAVVYLVVMVVVDALVMVVAVLTSTAGSAAVVVVDQLTALYVGLLLLLRLLFACCQLPRSTAHPLPARFAGRRRRNALVLIGVTVAAIALTLPLVILAFQHVPRGYRPLVYVALPLPFAGLVSVLRVTFLHVLRWLQGPDPEPGCTTPDVEVIIPAYNEEACIVDTLEAIELAARRYPGAVRVVLANDGSTDRTRELAVATGRRMTSAALEVIDVRHGGKSATLNAALARCTGEIVIRIDADTLVGEDSILYATRWFARPDIGLVESMPFPRPGRSPFRKLRLFETLRTFGFLHRGLQVVDAVAVVPGMFTAFRREAVVAIDGFTVGMNGEDADLTLTLGRLGWRSWTDPNVVIGEDVPPTLAEFRSQRVRWNRAGIHAFARHSPFRSGPADPRVWFSQMNQMLWKLSKPFHLTVFLYVVLLAAFRGPSRGPVEAALGGVVVLMGVALLLELGLVVRFGVTRRIGWMVLWLPFVLVKSAFALEALLSLPARPVTVPALRRAGAPVITEPVVH